MTGSLELGDAAKEFPALFRRAAIVCAVGALESQEVARYFCTFLRAFVSLEDQTWKRWAQRFALVDTAGRAWSIDSLQQYLMRRVRVAVERGFVERINTGSSGDIRNSAWRVPEGHVQAFVELMVVPEMCSGHLDHTAFNSHTLLAKGVELRAD